MDNISHSYQLQLSKQDANSNNIHHEQHYFQDLPGAMRSLVIYGLEGADHPTLAGGSQNKTIASIYESGNPTPLVELIAEPLTYPDLQKTPAGLYLHTPEGTIYDFEEKLGQDMFRIEGYDGNKKDLRVLAYIHDPKRLTTEDIGLVPLLENISEDIGRTGAFAVSFTQQVRVSYDPVSTYNTEAYHYDNAALAFSALLHHPYLKRGEESNFLDPGGPTSLQLSGPAGTLLMATDLVRHGDEGGHYWPQPGLFLSFPDGYEAFRREAAITAPKRHDPQFEDNALVIADFNNDFTRLRLTPAFLQLQQDIAREIGIFRPAVEPPYRLEHTYLPARILPELADPEFMRIVSSPVHSLQDGLRQLQAMAPEQYDRTHAVKHMTGDYLLHTKLFESGKEVIRLYKSPGTQELPAGLYLQVNPDNLSLQSLAALDLLSNMKQPRHFHFLVTHPGTKPAPEVKHGTTPRHLQSGTGSGRSL